MPEDNDEWHKRAVELLGHFKDADVKFDAFEKLLSQMIQEAENLKSSIKKGIE